MLPRTPVWKLVLGFVVLTIGVAIGIPLARYAERDDAPGGVLIAGLIVIGAALLAAWIVKPRSVTTGPQPPARQ